MMRKVSFAIAFFLIFLNVGLSFSLPNYTMKYFPNSVYLKPVKNDTSITIYKSKEWPEDIFSDLVYKDFYNLLKRFKRFDKVIYYKDTSQNPDYVITCTITQAEYKGSGADIFVGEIKGASAYVELEISLYDVKHDTYLIDDLFKGMGRTVRLSSHSHDPTWKYGDRGYRKSSLRVAVLNAIKSFLNEVDRKLPLEGYIAEIRPTDKEYKVEDEIAITLGRKDGVKKGMQFLVIKMDELIVHPVTGKPLELTEKVKGIIEVYKVLENISWTHIVFLKKGEELKIGDKIRRYKNTYPDKD